MKVSVIFQGKPLCDRILQEHKTFNVFSLLRIVRTNALNMVVKTTKRFEKQKIKGEVEAKLRFHICWKLCLLTQKAVTSVKGILSLFAEGYTFNKLAEI